MLFNPKIITKYISKYLKYEHGNARPDEGILKTYFVSYFDTMNYFFQKICQ